MYNVITMVMIFLLSAIIALIVTPSGDPITFCVNTVLLVGFGLVWHAAGVQEGRKRTGTAEKKATYDTMVKGDPVGGMITVNLDIAIREDATRISYGLPPGVVLTEEEEASIRQTDAEIHHACNGNSGKPDEATAPASGNAVEFHRRDGLPTIWCREVNGRWIPEIGLPAALYPCLLQRLSERLVSLGKNSRQGGKEQWIEYGDVRGGGGRQFVRVDFVIEDNNSITVELLETQVVQRDEEVWWKHQRV